MAYYDLREYMQACDAAGEMVTIDKELDWNLGSRGGCPPHLRNRCAKGPYDQRARGSVWFQAFLPRP